MQSIESLYTLLKDKLYLITTDSRKVQVGSIFLTLKGPNFNGNSFVEEALKKGAEYVICDEISNNDNRVITVQDAYETLVQLASLHRSKLAVKVIALTGTNGKTTTKELLYHIFKTTFKSYCTQGNLNNHIGVPLTLLQLNDSHEFLILEMGANKLGDIEELCKIADPDYGLITNIGKAHLEGFHSQLGILQTKTELFDYLNKKNSRIFFNLDSELLKTKLKEYNNIVSYGSSSLNANYFFKMEKEFPSILLSVATEKATAQFHSPLFGNHNFENLMAAITIGLHFNISVEDIQSGIESYVPKNMRSQILQWKDNTIILDAYNANPSSMSKSIQSLASFEGARKWVVLGEMAELGNYSKEEHQLLLESVQTHKFEKIILVGNEFKNLITDRNFIWFENADQCKAWWKENEPKNATVLIKGSRSVGLEILVAD
ncbi:MAG: UDP-N-acetylmuramoyl-tripeptide--D-alanyl-D-alanine ligase [Saprospiraceae bacterium]|nr:UDP-N-acetylmuramoyl-tripeptide--D-alanyl-D-alanine ligase [Saprospiraceae bacterium]